MLQLSHSYRNNLQSGSKKGLVVNMFLTLMLICNARKRKRETPIELRALSLSRSRHLRKFTLKSQRERGSSIDRSLRMASSHEAHFQRKILQAWENG